MAIIKAVSGKNKGSIARVIHYIMKNEKTDLKLITGINCEGSTDCIQQMKMTKAMYKKEGGRQYKHYVLSFHPDDFKDENGNLLPDSERLTKFGKMLRATSLDELPEAFNIAKGDMSILGPRPLLPSYLPWYTERERHRHDVRPGLSGLAPVSYTHLRAHET